MSDDLLKRLRMDVEPTDGDMEAAADEIERLRAENERLREALQNIVYADGDYNLLQARARAALGEGKK